MTYDSIFYLVDYQSALDILDLLPRSFPFKVQGRSAVQPPFQESPGAGYSRTVYSQPKAVVTPSSLSHKSSPMMQALNA